MCYSLGGELSDSELSLGKCPGLEQLGLTLGAVIEGEKILDPGLCLPALRPTEVSWGTAMGGFQVRSWLSSDVFRHCAVSR